MSSSDVIRAADAIEVLDAECHRHAPVGAVQVDRRRVGRWRAVVEHNVLKQQRRSAPRLLHDPVRDRAQFVSRRDRLGDAHELS